MKRIGLMGCGTVADYGHLPALTATPGLELVSVYEPDPVRREKAARKFGVPQAFGDEEAFFASGLDAVVVTSPAPCHCENVLAAARHGLHVLCEKPLATGDAEAAQMIGAMEAAGRMLFTAFICRFNASAIKIKELLAQGAIGQVRSLRLIYVWDLHGRYVRDAAGELVENPRRVGRLLEGGPMVDCGVHMIDLARWWLGSEVVRHRVAAAWVEDYEAPDHIYLHLDHADGAHTMIEESCTYCHTAAEPIFLYHHHLIGTGGVIRYEMESGLFEVRSSQGTLRLPKPEGKNFHALYAAFAEALETGRRDLLPSGQEGRIATRIARQATDTAIAGRPGSLIEKVAASPAGGVPLPPRSRQPPGEGRPADHG